MSKLQRARAGGSPAKVSTGCETIYECSSGVSGVVIPSACTLGIFWSLCTADTVTAWLGYIEGTVFRKVQRISGWF